MRVQLLPLRNRFVAKFQNCLLIFTSPPRASREALRTPSQGTQMRLRAHIVSKKFCAVLLDRYRLQREASDLEVSYLSKLHHQHLTLIDVPVVAYAENILKRCKSNYMRN